MACPSLPSIDLWTIELQLADFLAPDRVRSNVRIYSADALNTVLASKEARLASERAIALSDDFVAAVAVADPSQSPREIEKMRKAVVAAITEFRRLLEACPIRLRVRDRQAA